MEPPDPEDTETTTTKTETDPEDIEPEGKIAESHRERGYARAIALCESEHISLDTLEPLDLEVMASLPKEKAIIYGKRAKLKSQNTGRPRVQAPQNITESKVVTDDKAATEWVKPKTYDEWKARLVRAG